MTHTQHYTIAEVAPYINWLYFYHAWQLPTNGGSSEQTAARDSLKADALALLEQWQREGWHTHFRVMLVAAFGEDEDIVLPQLQRHLPLLRQQSPSRDGYCYCLADFVPDVANGGDTIGLFVSTVDVELERQFPDDDYRHLLAQTLADRLAEATAERGHEQTRREWWGYAPDEQFTPQELFAEKYVGKRPAVGYPSLPDQSFNFLLSEILDFSAVGVSLTENGAMMPHGSTSGLMFRHPRACHFSVGKIGDDQLQDYARRRGVAVEEIKRFLSGAQ